MKAKLVQPTPENLRRMAEAVRGGGIVAMPTETVYGLAADAFQPKAVTQVFMAKERPSFDPLIVHVPDTILPGGLLGLNGLGLVDTPLLSELAWERAEMLIQAFWPGPLTLVLPRLEGVPDLVTSGLPTIAVRMPRHPIAQELIRRCGPLAAPSANRFGRISPTQPSHVLEELGDRLEWIIDGGPCEVGLESSVVSIDESGSATLLRPGGLPRSEIEKVIAHPLVLPSGLTRAGPSSPAASPGSLDSHYAPGKPFYLLPGMLGQLKGKQLPEATRQGAAGLLLMSGPVEPAQALWKELTGHAPVCVRSLSVTGDLAESARGFFSMLRALDQSGARMLFSEPCIATQGLGHAIADRLRRASARWMRPA